MLFNSYEFIFAFLPITFFVYFYLNSKRLAELNFKNYCLDFWGGINSHVKEKIGNTIINTIFCKSSIYSNFITSDNVSKHLENLEAIGKLND